jgi:hypothetical protein
MSRYIDITGNKYNMLTVIAFAYVKKDSYWLCRCDCGNTKIVSVANLKSGQTKSCGCLHNIDAKKKMLAREEKEGRISLVGNKYGSLTVLKNKYDDVISKTWLCQCDCGKILEVPEQQLLKGTFNSCGCKNRENSKINVGKYVGRVDGTMVSVIKSNKISSANTSGVRGVSYHKKSSTWHAYIGFKGKLYELGYYRDRNDAVSARKNAEEKLYGEFLEWYENEFNKKDKGPEN